MYSACSWPATGCPTQCGQSHFIVPTALCLSILVGYDIVGFSPLLSTQTSLRSRATSPNPDPYSLSLPSGVVENPTALSASAPFVTALNLDLPPTYTLAGEALVSTTVPLRRSARLLSKMRPDYRLAGRSDDWTLVKEP